MSVNIGDKVQIKDGGRDVTNGYKAQAGYLYGEGGPSVATVESITSDWDTGGKFGLPKKVTKVRCSHKGVVVWQVQPKDIIVKVSNEIKKEKENKSVVKKKKTVSKKQPQSREPVVQQYNVESIGSSNTSYAITKGSDSWHTGTQSIQNNISYGVQVERKLTSKTHPTFFTNDISNTSYTKIKNLTPKQLQSIGTKSIKIDDSVQYLKFSTVWENKDKKYEMLNLKKEIIQNQHGFPFFIGQKRQGIPAEYDYQIIIGDPRYKNGPTSNLEDRLMEVRAELGLPVHGNNNIAKSMKYYMYNRFKTPDINLAHSKSFTYVFFTRPDLNLLEKSSQGFKAVDMIENHTEAAMTWRRYPELFKLLTDNKRCGDSNNFNLLLSNQIQSFDILDEELTTATAGKSWNEHEIMYGDSYSGRTANTFSCEFAETSNYEIINLLKLWITYIDNVGTGAWSPSYTLNGLNKNNINASHVHSKSLDYASSAYVFKCGPDGEDILYWSKYYGVFPLNTGSNALSWNIANNVGDGLRLNIKFGYSFKRDLSPISLIEFNDAAGVDSSNAIFESSYNDKLNHNGRPYVGSPYIEMDLGNPQLISDDVSRTSKKTQIRLKFMKDNKSSRSDSILYRA